MFRQTGYLSPNQLARVVDGSSHSRQKWQYYFSGERVPRKTVGRDSVAAAEAIWPGSAQPFRSCFWSILADKEVSKKALANEVMRLGVDIHFSILAGKGTNLLVAGPYERTVQEELFLLRKFPTFAGLQALVILLHRAEQLRSRRLWNHICDCYAAMKPALIERGDVPFSEHVLAAVDRYARIESLSDHGLAAARDLWRSAGATFEDDAPLHLSALQFIPRQEARKVLADPVYRHLLKMRLRDPVWKLVASSRGFRTSKNR